MYLHNTWRLHDRQVAPPTHHCDAEKKKAQSTEHRTGSSTYVYAIYRVHTLTFGMYIEAWFTIQNPKCVILLLSIHAPSSPYKLAIYLPLAA